MEKKKSSTDIVIYQAKNGAIELRGDFAHENIWATQAQIARAFDVDTRTINEHIQNIIKIKELSQKATIRNFRMVQMEGKRQIERELLHYNLDMILSVGYRVNSRKATSFRQWATKTLREHITQGYTINRRRIAGNYDAFLRSVADVQALLPAGATMSASDVLELIKEFAGTWVSLDAYDKGTLSAIGTTKKAVTLTGKELTDAIAALRTELLRKGEAMEIFAQERSNGSIEGIVGNVMQSFGGKPVYATVEEKAAHLLYFMVKNHPFVDGNKRSGAFAFVWFLRKARAKTMRSINAGALTALTLLVAESDPRKKDTVIALITQILH